MRILKSQSIKIIVVLLLSMTVLSCGNDQSASDGATSTAANVDAPEAANAGQAANGAMGMGAGGEPPAQDGPPPQGAPGTVEVALVDRMNGNDNHYCIDTVGARDQGDPADGLQGYTCYTDQGYVGYDQAMDPAAIAKGQFLMTGHNVCMQAKSKTPGSMLGAEPCDGGELQNFELRDDKTIRLKTADTLCLDIGGETRFGRGGPTGHQYRDLTLELCTEQRNANQQWYTRDTMEPA